MAVFLKMEAVKADDVERNLALIGLRMSDLDFRKIAAEGQRLAAGFAPKRSGALARTIKGSKSKMRASIKAGGTKAVPYAGAINYGWRKRNIEPSNFLKRADLVLRRTAPQELEAQIRRLISRQGL